MYSLGGECDVVLRINIVKSLIFANSRYPTILYDSKYVKLLANEVFGIECLKKSTVIGRNPNKGFSPLDPTKLRFVKGRITEISSEFISYSTSFFFICTDLFIKRVGDGDKRRMDNFTKILNKCCNSERLKSKKTKTAIDSTAFTQY